MKQFDTQVARRLANGDASSQFWRGQMVQTLLWACDIIDAANKALEPPLDLREWRSYETETPAKQFAPIGLEGTICSNCTKTVAYHYQTAEGWLFCEVPTLSRGVK